MVGDIATKTAAKRLGIGMGIVLYNLDQKVLYVDVQGELPAVYAEFHTVVVSVGCHIGPTNGRCCNGTLQTIFNV